MERIEDLMLGKAIATPTLVLALALAGCSEPPVDRGGPANPSPTASPSKNTAEATPSVSADTTRFLCERLNSLVVAHTTNEALAIANQKGTNAELRADIALAYADFTDGLIVVSSEASGELRSVLGRWALASSEVGLYIAETKPEPGVVVDYGPAQDRFDSAKRDTEKICGHPLPNFE